jgi:hypothetical protein
MADEAMYLVKKTTRDSIALAGEGIPPEESLVAKHAECDRGLSIDKRTTGNGPLTPYQCGCAK